jgi:hypothetical protein
MLLYETTGDEKWEERALHAKGFVGAMWNEEDEHFWTGTLDDGVTINDSNIPVDIQAWAIMAMNSFNSAISWAEDNCYTETDGFKGFDFNNDRDGIWFEGTAQMAVAYQINGEASKSDFYTSELIKAQISATNANGKGIVAASHDGVTTGFDWEYFSRLHIGTTAWYIFAEMNYNPYWGTTTISDEIPGNFVTTNLWIKAIINTVEKGPIEAVWKKGGEDTTSRGDRVIWGHFYASPTDVTWGSSNNPDLFVKIWFDVSGRVDVNYFHVSVPNIEVYSDYPYDGTPDEQGTTTMSRRYIRQYYEGGQSYSEEDIRLRATLQAIPPSTISRSAA